MGDPSISDQPVGISRVQLRRVGATLIEPGFTRDRVVEIAGAPDEESEQRMIWKVGISGADQLYFVVELDSEKRATRAYRAMP